MPETSRVHQPSDGVKESSMGARAFYFTMYALFYLSVLLYPNKLTDALYDPLNFGNLLYVSYFFTIQCLATYFFITAGLNPGYVDETQTEEIVSIKVAGGDEEDDEEAVGFSMNQQSVELRNLEHTDEEEEKSESKDKAVEKKSLGFVAEVELPQQRFCNVCQLQMPFRSRHCRDCNRCVRKFDHHCFWIGGCVGELNHGKFFLCLFFQTWNEMLGFGVANNGHEQRFTEYPDPEQIQQQNHVQAVWMFFLVLFILFVLFTGVLGGYHLYLICSGQTTWEHSGRMMITYMKPYKSGVMPFYHGIGNNLKMVFFHGGKCKEWKLEQPAVLKERQGFNVCDNEYYSCC